MDWLLRSNGGLVTRVSLGVVVFTVLGVIDWRRHRRAATRWKEYGVLLIAAAVAMGYGAINDQITSRLSWEYFYYGKGLADVLGPQTPPAAGPLHWEAAKVGVSATWSAGLIVGVALLLANNPRREVPRLRNRDLLRCFPVILAGTIVFSVAGWVAGYCGGLTHCSREFEQITRESLFRPRRFVGVWGEHLGGYVGAVAGTVWGVVRCLRWRSRGVLTPVHFIAPGGSAGGVPPAAGRRGSSSASPGVR